MAKLPYMQFYPADFVVATQTLSLEEIGAWMKMICHIWIHSKSGTIAISNAEICQLFAIPEDKAMRLFCSLWDKRIFDNKRTLPTEDYQIEDNNFIINEVTSRRISRDKKKLKLNALYVSKHRSKVGGNENVRNKKSEVRSQKSDKESPLPPFKIPDDLLTSQAEIGDWLEYKRQRGQSYKPKGLEALWRNLRAIPGAARRACVDQSMANNWSGLFYKGATDGQDRVRSNAAATGEPEGDDSRFAGVVRTVKIDP